MPTVSVIVPLFNKGSLVVRAIESIFSQSFQDFEVIVIDDGSTDGSPDHVKQIKDSRLRLFHQTNAGPGAARNRGVKESSSLYLAFLDADDEWYPEFLQTSITNLSKNPDCALSILNHLRGDNKTIATEMEPCIVGITNGSWQLNPRIEPIELWGNIIFAQTWVVVCRRDIFQKYGGFYEHHCTYAEDIYQWLQIFLNHKVYRDLTPLHWYHIEDSDLEGPNRLVPIPIFSFLEDPEPIRQNCPSDYLLALEKFFGLVAAMNFNIMYKQNNISSAMYILKKFPMMKEYKKNWRWILFKLRIKLAFPWIVTFYKGFRHVLNP